MLKKIYHFYFADIVFLAKFAYFFQRISENAN